MRGFNDGDEFEWESNKSDCIFINGENIGDINLYFSHDSLRYQYEGTSCFIVLTDNRNGMEEIKYRFLYLGNKTLLFNRILKNI